MDVPGRHKVGPYFNAEAQMLGSFLVEPIRAAMFALAHMLGGSLGAGILAASLLLRLALLPLTVRLARRSAAQQRLLQSIKPEITALNTRYAKEPEALWRETQKLHGRVGYRAFDLPVLLGSLVRLPLFGGIFGALKSLGGSIRFAWIADLARPNVPLTLLVASVSGASAYFAGMTGNSRGAPVMAAVATGISIVFFWHFSSGLVLSWGASSVIDLVQGALLARERRQHAAT